MIRVLAFLSLTLVLITSGFAQCRAPRYRVGRDFSNSELGLGSVQISIRPKEFTRKGLICLARTFNESHPQWKTASVLVFTSYDAARFFVAGWKIDGPPRGDEWARKLHAVYELDRSPHKERLTILPLGFDSEPSSITTIDLLRAEIPHCRLEVNDRCVMAMEGPAYPNEALNSKVSGKITLAGTLTPSGKITGIQVEETGVDQSRKGKVLVEAAIGNLRSWQLEPGRGQTSIRITYSYIIDRFSDQLTEGASFNLPNQIVIRGKPHGGG